ncbi:von Willebrand factor A domain-containing protein 7-like isoform X1 [Asterias amurensis]|uniref:von Willebrand factor A domain-containing protein 7-like isoform X1 n=1 Tax=Asterias amurensis TaxID=7602 RepID=UPI003AB38DFC
MKPTVMLHVLISVSLITQGVAFLPSRTGITLPDTDYTLTDITVAGIVRVVAKYFEDSNPDRYSPGNLTGLDPLTPSSLFQVHYGDCASFDKFDGAIDTITNHNIRMARVFPNKAEWHFNGNQINAGHQKMMGIRKRILDVLTVGDENAPDYDVARINCGNFLHLAHSFYSNTNWIELNRFYATSIEGNPEVITPSRNLGINANLTFQECPSSVEVCRNCVGGSANVPESQDCSDNLHDTICIASGFRSGQDRPKTVSIPPKCSHGGINDWSRLMEATGGINKETSDPSLSPHHFLHQQAALTAIQATVDFFYHADTGLYNLIGEQKFRKLLNLDVGTSLTFVIDTTGSMSDEIQAVKDQTIELINTNSGTCLAAFKYVVVPFNDPEFGPAFVTADPQECIRYISGLTADGGGDCPEMANSGLELGIQNSLDGNKVYLYTDADDKDKEKLPTILALIEEKGVQVEYLLTGTCTSRRRRRALSTTTPSSSFLAIASKSGGTIYSTDDAGIRGLSRVIQGNIRASQATVLKMNVRNSTAPVEIPVDSTIQELLVSIIGPLDSTTVNIRNPQGAEGSPSILGADIFTSSAQQIVFSFNTTSQQTKGNWILKLQNVNPTSEYKITVSAKSLLDFTFDLMEVDQSGTAYPLEGLPVAGVKVLIQIKISSQDMISSISEIRLFDTSGRERLFSGAAEPIPGRTQGLYLANVTLPEQPFVVSILGVDSKGARFLRAQPAEVQVGAFKLEQVIGNNTIEELHQGSEGSLVFRVTNKGPADTMVIAVSVGANRGAVKLNVSVEQVLAATVEPLTMKLASGKTQEGVITVRAADTVPIGTTVKVTLTVSSNLSLAINILSVDVTVVEVPAIHLEIIDRTLPTCVVLDTGGNCTADQMTKDCHLHEWWVRIQATDETALAAILPDPEVGFSQSFVYEEFSLNGVTALYKAPCCCPKLNITVRDGNGNTASCGNDFYTPVAGKIEEPLCNGPIIDSIPPTCTILAVAGNCTADQMTTNCHLHEWWVRIQATDDTNLTEFLLEPQVGLSQSLEYEESSLQNVTALYKAPCCCPKLNVTVIDGNGNTASCGNDFYTQMVEKITEPVCNGPINIVDSNPPTCSVLDTGGGCTADQMSTNCHLHEWWVRIQATDETNLTEFLLEPQVGLSQSLEYEERSLQNVTALYKAPCCCPKLNITVRDGNGNTASCGEDFYTSMAGTTTEPICNGLIVYAGSSIVTGVVVGIVVGCCVLILILLIVAFVKLYKTRETSKEENSPQKSKEDPAEQVDSVM